MIENKGYELGDRECLICKKGVCGEHLDLTNEIFVNLNGINLFVCKECLEKGGKHER